MEYWINGEKKRSRRTGMMEYWKNGAMGKAKNTKKKMPNIPVFLSHYSIIPLFHCSNLPSVRK